MTSIKHLSGKTALVTGSSTGIGAAIAKELAGLGANVILHGRGMSPEIELTAQLLGKAGSKAHCLCCDFTDTGALSEFAEAVWNVHGGVDIVVNNAGGDVLTGDQASLSPTEKLDLLYAIDCRATFQLSRDIGARMKQASEERGERCIVNIGWDQSFQGMEGDSGEIFSTIKGSVMSMTLSLAQSLAPEVRVNCVAPGWIKTDWGQQTSDYWTDRAISESLMSRWGTPDDVANAVSFLVSDKANFICGQILNVNGGFRFNQSRGMK